MNYSAADSNHPDMVILYNDHDNIAALIEPLLALGPSFKSMPANEDNLAKLLFMRPKVLLLGLNHISQSIQYYVRFLERLKDSGCHHCAVLLVSNKEARRAFLACENGLFDNYVVINPQNERYRLRLIILKALASVNERRGEAIEQLLQEGEDELAKCIARGSELKQGLLSKLQHCQHSVSAQALDLLPESEAAESTRRVIDGVLSEYRDEFDTVFGDFIDDLERVQAFQRALTSRLEQSARQQQGKNLSLESIEDIAEHGELVASDYCHFRILIGENSELYAKVVADIFLEENFQVAVAKDGCDTFEKFLQFKPDLVILAYDLPKLNGIEVTRKIRASSAGKSVPIVAFSNIKDRRIISQWIPLGLSAYLVKPSSNDVILSTVLHELTHPVSVLPVSESLHGQRIVWKPEYSVGDTEMDRHHQMLFSIINDYFHSDHHDLSALQEIFVKLADYVEFHFKAEETLMAERHYPKLEQHIVYHQEFIKKLAIMKAKLNEPDSDIINKIGMFLYRWLTKHILGADMAYKHYFERH